MKESNWKGGNTFDWSTIGTRLGPGDYVARISEAKPQASSKGNPMVVCKFAVYESAADTTAQGRVTDRLVLTPEGAWKFKVLGEALGLDDADLPEDDAEETLSEFCKTLVEASRDGVGLRLIEEPYEKDGQQRMALRVNRFLTPEELEVSAAAE